MANKKTPVERHILIGLITSTEYLHEIREVFDIQFLQTEFARIVAGWCLDYYDTYQKAPGPDVEAIYFEELRKGRLPEDVAEELEEDILPDLSQEYERAKKFNVQYLLDRTKKYFSERNLELWQQQIQTLRDGGEIEQAERLAQSYAPVVHSTTSEILLSDPQSLKRVEHAFGTHKDPLLEYPGAVGEFLNEFLTRDSFVSFLAPEKRGKSYFMLDMARRAVRQRLNVAFFQAGDMSEAQQLRRLGIQLAKKSDLEHYAGKMWEPVKDCIKNQADTCNLKIRERQLGLEGEEAPYEEEVAREGLTKEQLIELHKENPKYRPCHNCLEYQSKPWGCAWIQKVDVGAPLQKNEAMRLFEEYFVNNKRSFMLSTHPNNTLTIPKMKGILEAWYRKGFVPDLIVIDYADLLDDPTSEFRHKQDKIWKGLRSLSEEFHALVVTATQADAKSYEMGLLRLSNFSEDKRKYAHVTAMFGLNQDPMGKEKDVGIMRLNQLVVREGASNPNRVVHVLQNLKRGQPILTSYW